MNVSSGAGPLENVGRKASEAARLLALVPTDRKNEALERIAGALERRSGEILGANQADVEEARLGGLSEALLDRLSLTDSRIAGLAAGVRQVVGLPDPVGREFDHRALPSGLRLRRRSVPLGVVGAIYEARPNVTVDIAALCLKTGNAVILRGGSETLRTNRMLADILRDEVTEAGLPRDAVQFIDSPDRALVAALLRLDRYVDMIVPRGGEALHRLCREQGTIPVITGGIGICHMFVDESADLIRALDIVENAKTQRPSVCNALDTLLVHTSVAGAFLPAVAARLSARGVELRTDPDSTRLLEGSGEACRPAGDGDFDREWLSLVLGIRVVTSLDEAIAHIRAHSTRHSDAILTNDRPHADRFVREVDSAAVYVNASTRFTDGGEFGLGAEVAVSTQKLHARGPMGLEALTTYKWIGEGDGLVRS